MKINDRLPYSSDPTFVSAPGASVRVKPYQIVVAVSVSLQALLEWDLHTPRFPAILDTGNNHNLSISRGQLLRWAGLLPEALRIIGAIRERQQRIPLHSASVWLPVSRGLNPEKVSGRLCITTSTVHGFLGRIRGMIGHGLGTLDRDEHR